MDRKAPHSMLVAALVGLAISPVAHARPAFPNTIPTPYSCSTCHINPNGGGPRNAFGMAYDANRSWSAICSLDSDGDGVSNGAELGDPSCQWSPGDALPPGPTSRPADATDTITPVDTDPPVDTDSSPPVDTDVEPPEETDTPTVDTDTTPGETDEPDEPDEPDDTETPPSDTDESTEETDEAPPSTEEPEPKGCGCQSSPALGSAPWLALLVGLTLRRRSRDSA